jgi:mRNA-degrading endonuclease RelE of RelBE toxin-antitoxin system
MISYRLLIDFEVIEFIDALPKSLQRSLRSRLVEIRDFPSIRSDCSERDSVGRRIEINICSGYAIKYWIDSADRHVKILDIHPADRPR